MKFSEVMSHYDYKKSNIAKALGVSRQLVFNWHKKDKIPFSKQCELEILTKGALKASKED